MYYYMFLCMDLLIAAVIDWTLDCTVWVNRFANAGDAAIEVAEKTMEGV